MYQLNNSKSSESLPSNFVILEGIKYPVLVEGTGKIPCLCIGIGSLMLRTLSNNFKNIFTIYSTDLYWIQKQRLTDPYKLTIKQIVDDILNVIAQLNLSNLVILAHSCYGIVALEVAKIKSTDISGVI